jgi:DNA-binding response OmpR family regulator
LQLPPTIIITGHLSKYQDVLAKYHISLDDVVEKPLTFEILEERINKKLGEQMLPEEVGSEYENKIYQNNRCRIGFVEDEADLVKDLTEFFTERKYKVSCFKNGVTALEALKANPVDILFVDIKLPGIQGDELIEELSKLPNAPFMIPMSADPLPDGMQERLSDLKCGDFMEKPFDLIELIERVKTIAIKKGLLG